MSLIHSQKHFHHQGDPSQKDAKFSICSFNFQFRSRCAFGRYGDFSALDISYVGVKLTFRLVLVDEAADCSPP